MSRELPRHLIERLTVNLHERIRADGLESGAAETLREEILDRWDSLEPNDKDALNNLSGDLYALSDEEERQEGAAGDLVSMRAAWAREDWAKLLSLARRNIPGLTEASRLYVRAHAYESLGFSAAAKAFLSRVGKIDETFAHLVAAHDVWRSTNEFVRLLGEWQTAWPADDGHGSRPFRASSSSLRRAVRIIQHDRFQSQRIRTDDGVDELVIRCALTEPVREHVRDMVADWLTDGGMITGATSQVRGPLDINYDDPRALERAA
jgi:hypothetical protein